MASRSLSSQDTTNNLKPLLGQSHNDASPVRVYAHGRTPIRIRPIQGSRVYSPREQKGEHQDYLADRQSQDNALAFQKVYGQDVVRRIGGQRSTPRNEVRKLRDTRKHYFKWRNALEEALIAEDLEAVKHSYKKTLAFAGPDCTKRIAQLLHQKYRQERQNNGSVPSLLEFASELIRDLKSEQLAPNPWAIIHLIGIFKESGRFQDGVDLWNFIAGKDGRYVNASTYGALIELLTARGDSLESLEELYEIGLKSDASLFAKYHFMPNAIEKDRSKGSTGLKLPLALLQGIYLARLKHEDKQNAYLALDTALRLAPEKFPTAYFGLPILSQPVHEAYTVFMLACRTGVNVGPGAFRILLSKMNKIHEEKSAWHLHYQAIRGKQRVLRAMINALISYSAVGGQVEVDHLRAFYVAIGKTMWTKRGVAAYPEQHEQAARAVEAMIFRVSELFSQLNLFPDRYTFSAMLMAAGKAGSEQVHTVLQHMSSLNLEPDIYAYRALLLCAGTERDLDLLKQTWNYLAQMHHGSPTPTNGSWWFFTRACIESGFRQFCREELDRTSKTLPLDEATREQCIQALDESIDPTYRAVGDITSEGATIIADRNLELSNEIQKLVGRLRFEEPLADKLPGTSLKDPLIHRINEDRLQRIYDDLTADPSEPKDSLPDVNSMGIPLDKLRYENWKSITALLHEVIRDKPLSDTLSASSNLEDMKRTILELRGLA